MLDLAIKYEERLKALFSNVVFDKEYMFYSGGSYRDAYESIKSTWSCHEFVSITNEGKVLGYIKYNICRDSLACRGLQIINFSNSKATFGKDVMRCLDELFTKFQFRKLSYCVYVGNPIEKTYDKLTTKYGGRIVGTKVKDDRLLDGNYYDLKLYEIFREDYLRRKDELKYDKTTSTK